MKVLIVEDELIAAHRLIRLLNRVEDNLEVADHLDSIRSTVEWVKQNPPPDLLFLDIQLADGVSFEIFDRVEVRCPVIFTTAYSHYAIQAFKVNSIDYLLKPIAEEELKAALQKYHSRKIEMGVDTQALLDLLKGEKSYKERWVIKVGEHLKSVSTKDVEVFYSSEKLTYLQKTDGKRYIIDFTLDRIEEIVDPSQFFRVNRKQIVRIDGIRDIISYSSSRLKVLMNNYDLEDIVVSRDRVGTFKSWLDR